MKKLLIILTILIMASMSTAQEVRIGANMVLDPGTKMHVDANLDIQAAELAIKPGATLIMGNGHTLTVKEGGAIKALGNENNQAIVSSTGYFVFIVSDGGTIGANYATFEKMSGSGLTIEDGAIVDPDHPLSHSIFQNGSSSSTLLTINNNQYLTIDGAVFISAPDMELYNVAKTLNQGIVNFINYGGNFAGEDFEDDDHNRIFWGATAPFDELATGTVGSGTELCLDALDVIIVEDLLVESGGFIELVAGQRILLLPGVLVQNNGKLHARISTDGIFCQPPSMLASAEPQPQTQPSQPLNPLETDIKVYPNPTTGNFTLELNGFEESETVLVQIFTMQGILLSALELPASSRYNMSLNDRQPGIYVIRVVQGGSLGVARAIKQ